MKSSMNGDLHDQVMRYLDDTPRRRLVHDAVYDAIEGFCAEGCVWVRGQYEDGYTHKAGCNKYIYRASGGYRFDKCPHCNRRIIEQFDILKEEGV